MRTEQDLRDVFAVLDAHAPTELSRPEAEPRARASKRVVPLVAVAATVAAVAAGAPLLLSSGHRPTTALPAGPPEQPVTLRYSFTVGPVPGYTITPAGIHRDLQQADVTIGGTDHPTGAVYVFTRGAFDPAAARRGRNVTLHDQHGSPAYYAATLPSPTLLDDQGNPAKLPALVWQYAPDAWAMVQADFRPLAAIRGQDVSALAEELKIAEAVRTGHPQAVRVPFRFGYLPPGLVAEGAAPEQGGMWIYLGDGRPGDPNRGVFGSALSVWVYGATDPGGVFCQGGRTFTARGLAGCFDGEPTSAVYLNVPGGLVELLVDAKHGGVYSDAQLKRIVTSLRLASIHDPASWFDATTAVAH